MPKQRIEAGTHAEGQEMGSELLLKDVVFEDTSMGELESSNPLEGDSGVGFLIEPFDSSERLVLSRNRSSSSPRGSAMDRDGNLRYKNGLPPDLRALLSDPNIPGESDEARLRRVTQRKTLTEIAAETGRSLSSISQVVAAHGFKKRETYRNIRLTTLRKISGKASRES